MKEPLGEFGGEVTRKLTLFNKQYEVGERISSEILKKVSIRHRRAIQNVGLVKYYSAPEGADAFEPETQGSVVNKVRANTKSSSTNGRAVGKKTSRSRRK